MGTRWRSMLAPINKPTGDGRRMAAGAFTHRELPLPLKWQRQDDMGHDASVVIGLMDTLTIDEDAGEVWGEGELFDDQPELPRLSEDVAEALLLTSKKVIGPSVDAGAAEAILVEAGSDEPLTEERMDELWFEAESGDEPQLELLFTHYEIAAATLVAIPAFTEARPFELLDTPAGADAALVAAVIGATDLPVAARDTSWDGDAARGRVFDMCTSGDTVDVDCVSRAFLWRDPDADAQTKGAFKLPFADVIDGELRIVPAGVAATAGGRGVDAADIPAEDKDRIKARICTLYDRIRSAGEEFEDWPECPFEGDSSASEAKAALIAALTAASGIKAPPAEWFDDPKLDRLTPLTVTDDGRVYGHVAAWGTCHLEFKDVCVTAPQPDGYAAFHRYTRTDDGMELPVAAGRLTTGFGRVGTGCGCCRGKDDHACIQFTLGRTIAHYDQLRTLAYVRAHRDEHGQVVAGWAPNLTKEDRRVLARRKASCDWREVAGNLELVEVLALARENPGFPLPTTAMRGGRQTALVAAGTVNPDPPAPRFGPSQRINWAGLAENVADLVVDRLRAQSQSAQEFIKAMGGPAVTAADGHTGAMVALVPTAEHAARLAADVDGAEPTEQLHLTLAFLGKADDIGDEIRAKIAEGVTGLVTARQAAGAPDAVEGEAFAVNLFNPGGDEPAIVLGVGGDQLEPFRTAVLGQLAEVEYLTMPDQHQPWVAHVTLAYSGDVSLVEQLSDRVGPVTFDRLRLAFGDQVVDIPLAAVGDSTEGQGAGAEAAALAAELAETTALVHGHRAAALAAELAEVS